jgi:hypothetical protein
MISSDIGLQHKTDVLEKSIQEDIKVYTQYFELFHVVGYQWLQQNFMFVIYFVLQL